MRSGWTIAAILALVLMVPAGSSQFFLFSQQTSNNYFLWSQPDSGSLIDKTVSFSSLEEWSTGSFNGTSASRDDNSGNLGIGYGNGTPGDSLKLYYRFDETVSGAGGTVKDFSGNGVDGVTANTLSTSNEGIMNTGSFDFDTSDYVNSTSFSAGEDLENSEFTLSAWVNNENLDTDGNVIARWGEGTPFPGHFILFHDTGGGGDGYGLVTYDGGYSTVGLSTSSAEANTWQHVAATYDGSQGTIYVDGQETASSSLNVDSTIDKPIVIGTDNAGNKKFEGRIDEVRVYNRSLSSTEIKNLYFSGQPFRGNYTTEEIKYSEKQNWQKVEVKADIPAETEISGEFRALSSGGNVIGTDSFSLVQGTTEYIVNVQDSRGAELVFSGNSTDPTETWQINSTKVKFEGPEEGGGWSKWN